jgi:hypothetical protein
MGGKGSQPQAPDPYQAANAQYQYGTKTADYLAGLNRINTSGPNGSVSYSVSGRDPTTGAPIYTQNTRLSPEQQKLYNANTQGSLALSGAANQAIGNTNKQLTDPLGFMKGVGGVQTQVPGMQNLQGVADKYRNAAYSQQTQYLDPQYKQQGEQLDAQLRNQGAHPGDPAYDNAMTLFNNQKQQAYTNAFNNSYQEGLGAQQTNYGEALGNAQFGNAGQQQQYGQAFQNQNLPINQLNALRSGSQVQGPAGQNVGSAGQPNMGQPDIMGAMNNQYLGQLNGYNASTGSKNSLLGDAGTLGAAYFMGR